MHSMLWVVLNRTKHGQSSKIFIGRGPWLGWRREFSIDMIYSIYIYIWFQKHYPTPPRTPQPHPKNPAATGRNALQLSQPSLSSPGGRWREFRVLGSGLQGRRGRGVDGCPSGDEQGPGGGGLVRLKMLKMVEVEKCHMEIRLTLRKLCFFCFSWFLVGII